MRSLLGCFALSLAFLSNSAFAFSLRTHVYVAEQILDDAKDCSLDVGFPKPYELDPVVCAALASHPAYFRGGVLGPDVFPDFVVGQVTTHPGVEGGWEAGAWLRHVLGSTKPSNPAEVAFSFGFMVHSSSDVFAHSYVNTYAGDIFDLKGESLVEERHFRLEKFIEKHTPATTPASSATIKVPERFLSNALVFDREVQGQYLKGVYAPHLLAIALDRNVARETTVAYTKLRDFILDLIAEYYKLQYGLIEKGNAAKLSLDGAKLALDVAQKHVDIEAEARRLAGESLEFILRTIEENPDLITAQLKLIEEKLKLVSDLAREAGELNSQIERVENRLREVRNEAAGAVCDIISGETCSRICPKWLPCKLICKPFSTVSGACHAARRLVDQVEGTLAGLQQDLRRNGAALAKATSERLAAEAEVQRLRIALEAAHLAREGATQAVLIHEKYLEAKRKVLDEAHKTVAAAEKVYNDIMAELRRVTDVFDALKDIAKRLDPLGGLLNNLVDGIERATDAYMEASLKGGIAAINGDTSILAMYREWLNCWGHAYLGLPWQAGQAYCEVAKEAQKVRDKLQHEIDDIKGRLPAPLPHLFRAYDKFREDAEKLAKTTALKSGAEFAGFIARDPNLPRFIELLADPTMADRQGLNDAFKTSSNAGGTDLLAFPDVASMIEKDASIAAGGTLDPGKFEALHAAIVLSKLSVLDYRALNRMYLDQGGGESSSYPDGLPLYPDTGRLESAIADGVRSLDGNHQWQAYGIPYPRASSQAEPLQLAKRHFGYTPIEDRPQGLRLFADPRARNLIFLELFPRPFIGEVTEYLSNHKRNPFMTCEAVPYPFTVGDDGAACRSDKRCLSWWRIRNWIPKIADEITCDR